MGIAESHLTGANGISVDEYSGSGITGEIFMFEQNVNQEVSGLLRDNICDQFDIHIVEDSTGGIIWIQ